MALISHKINQKTILYTLVITLTSVLSFLLILISTFGKPVADQYSFINRFNNSGTIGLVNDIYTHNSGRISQAIGIGMSYSIFGPIKSQILVPALLFVLLSAVLSWFFYLIIKKSENHCLKSITLGTLISSIILYVAPCLFDIYLWLDAGFVYMGSLIGLIFNINVFIWMLKTPNFMRKKFFIPLAILCVLNLLFNESVVALSFGWSLIALLSTMINKKWQKYRLAALTIFIISTIAILIMFFAPGTRNRMGAESGTASLLSILVYYPFQAFLNIMGTWTLWKIALACLAGIIIGPMITTKIKPRTLLISAALSLATITYGTLAVTFYGQKYGGIASRTMFTPNLGIILAIILTTAALFNIFFKKNSISQKTTASLLLAILCCCLAAPGFLRFNRDFLSVLAIRNNYLARRDALVSQYQNNKINKLILPDIPVMLKNSDASDFSVNNTRYYDWFYDNFLNYHQINRNDLTIEGGEIKSDWWDIEYPSWYQITKMQICLESNSLIDQKYICSNQ